MQAIGEIRDALGRALARVDGAGKNVGGGRFARAALPLHLKKAALSRHCVRLATPESRRKASGVLLHAHGLVSGLPGTRRFRLDFEGTRLFPPSRQTSRSVYSKTIL
jgi:hypothetical protein